MLGLNHLPQGLLLVLFLTSIALVLNGLVLVLAIKTVFAIEYEHRRSTEHEQEPEITTKIHK